MKKMVVLVADKNTQFMLKGLLTRHRALGVESPINKDVDIYVHPLRDPGVFNQAAEFLRPYQNQYQYALVFLDREGSGQENMTACEIAQVIKRKLEINGWRNRAEVIVLDPELEIWAWVNSRHLAAHTGWSDMRSLKDFLRVNKFWNEITPKPDRPKEAFEALLREKRIQRSSVIYKKIATDVDFNDCIDPAFEKFRSLLGTWFKSGDDDEQRQTLY